MGDYPELHTLGLLPDTPAATAHAAVLAVLLRVDNGRLTPSDGLTVLQSLGLTGRPQEQETHLPSAANQARSRRRAKAREREEREAS